MFCQGRYETWSLLCSLYTCTVQSVQCNGHCLVFISQSCQVFAATIISEWISFGPFLLFWQKLRQIPKHNCQLDSTGFFFSMFCFIYNVYLYIIHHFSQIFINCSNRSFVEKPRMSWFEAKDHCESGGGKVFFLENYSKKDGKFFQKSWEVFFR